MRILHVIRDLDLSSGGPIGAIFSFAKMQADKGDDVVILTTDYQLSDYPKFDNITVISVPCTLKRWRYSSRFSHVAREQIERADITHVHMVWEHTTYGVYKLCKELKKPFILRPCGMLDSWSMQKGGLAKKVYYKMIAKQVIKSATALHFTSNTEQADSAKFTENKNSFVCGIPLKDNYIEKNPDPTVGNNSKSLLFVGRLHEFKRPDLAIKSFKIISQTHPEFELIIAGNGSEEYSDYLKSLVYDLAIEDKVKWVGLLNSDQLKALYRSSYLLVAPSMYENYGNVLIESLSQSCPIVLTPEAHFSEDLVRNECGAVAQAEENALAEEVSKLIQQPKLREIMAENARKYVEKRFMPDTVYTQLVSQYKTAIS